MSRDVRFHEGVERPYPQVRDALVGDAAGVFQAATRSASSRARDVASALRANLAGIELASEVDIVVQSAGEQVVDQALLAPVARLDLCWSAHTLPRLFPFMRASLFVYPVSDRETRLEFSGRYEPPFGPLGGVIDALAGRHIAEAAVQRFVADVADYLRRNL